ncbi:MAG: hypothetical protein RL141_335 [Candidatus Parcubacteria bacterium]
MVASFIIPSMKIPPYLQILSGVLLAVLCLFVGLKSWNAYAEHSRIGVAVRDRDTIAVQGTGKVTASPDLALVNLGVQTEADTVRAGQDENTKKMNAIVAMLKASDIKADDITTGQYSISPRYNWDSGKQELVGYTVDQSVSVKIRDLDAVGETLAKAGDLGANQVGGIQFTIDEPESLEDEARSKAITDATEKAKVLADQLGLQIRKAVSFSESTGGYPAPYPMLAERAYDAMNMGGAAPVAPDIQAGSQDVISNVSVIFEVY